jgi:hypothetical protein
MTFQSELISELAKVIPEADRMRGVIYGFLLIGMMIFFPRGLAGFTYRLAAWRTAWAGNRAGGSSGFGNIMARLGAARRGDEPQQSRQGHAEEEQEGEEKRG